RDIEFQGGRSGLIVAGQCSLAVLHLVADGIPHRRGAGCGSGLVVAVTFGGLRGAAGNVVRVGTAVLRIIGVGGDVIQIGIDAGGGHHAGILADVGVLGIAALVLEDLGSVEVLVTVFLAQLGQRLVELVDAGLHNGRIL